MHHQWVLSIQLVVLVTKRQLHRTVIYDSWPSMIFYTIDKIWVIIQRLIWGNVRISREISSFFITQPSAMRGQTLTKVKLWAIRTSRLLSSPSLLCLKLFVEHKVVQEATKPKFHSQTSYVRRTFEVLKLLGDITTIYVIFKRQIYIQLCSGLYISSLILIFQDLFWFDTIWL